jgi:hypothetical protein
MSLTRPIEHLVPDGVFQTAFAVTLPVMDSQGSVRCAAKAGARYGTDRPLQ